MASLLDTAKSLPIFRPIESFKVADRKSFKKLLTFDRYAVVVSIMNAGSGDSLMTALCVVAQCPACKQQLPILPGNKYWRCLPGPSHRDEVHCPVCGNTFDTDTAELFLQSIQVQSEIGLMREQEPNCSKDLSTAGRATNHAG
jgi:hypothetical protein